MPAWLAEQNEAWQPPVLWHLRPELTELFGAEPVVRGCAEAGLWQAQKVLQGVGRPLAPVLAAAAGKSGLGAPEAQPADSTGGLSLQASVLGI